METTKVTVNIVLPGKTMVSKEAVKENPKANTYHTAINIVEEKYNKKTRKKEKTNEVLHIFTRKSIPAKQNICLSADTFNYMTSRESFVQGYNIKTWLTMSKKARLEAHLNELCQAVGGLSYTYEILED